MTAPVAFSALTFAVVPVVSAGALTTNLPAGTVIAGILDPVSTDRVFNPYAEGLLPASGDAVNTWLPQVAASGGLTAAQVNDQYWSNVPGNTVPASNLQTGQVTLKLTPGAKNTVEAPSVMTFKLSPNALIITTTTSAF